jgi:hypothetical protein
MKYLITLNHNKLEINKLNILRNKLTQFSNLKDEKIILCDVLNVKSHIKYLIKK